MKIIIAFFIICLSNIFSFTELQLAVDVFCFDYYFERKLSLPGLFCRWDDDVVFKNCAKGEDDKKKSAFINDTLRSEFHKKFMEKYIK